MYDSSTFFYSEKHAVFPLRVFWQMSTETHRKLCHLKLNISKIDELIVNYNASNLDVAEKKLQILRHECFTHMISHSQAAQEI